MDESGDLGFSPKSSISYTIGYVIMPTSTPHFVRNKCCRLLKKVNMQLKANKKLSEFKFSNDSHDTRLKFLGLIKSLDIDIGVVAVMKDSVKDHLKENPNVLYNYLAVHYVAPVIVSNYLKSFMPLNRIKFVIDRSLSKQARDRFDYYFDNTRSYAVR